MCTARSLCRARFAELPAARGRQKGSRAKAFDVGQHPKPVSRCEMSSITITKAAMLCRY
eukprot:NODE_8158_length_399_cov_3.543605.p5 GENE.NODE_8158_length_399_cov_3.543605~~NODE_8158_length_399_cov_3.543605.p5  ORF type:complete len:59 (+),score=5.94 NODE_8158_length_399_cov_3.543605:155-331(+)